MLGHRAPCHLGSAPASAPLAHPLVGLRCVLAPGYVEHGYQHGQLSAHGTLTHTTGHGGFRVRMDSCPVVVRLVSWRAPVTARRCSHGYFEADASRRPGKVCRLRRRRDFCDAPAAARPFMQGRGGCDDRFFCRARRP